MAVCVLEMAGAVLGDLVLHHCVEVPPCCVLLRVAGRLAVQVYYVAVLR